MQVNSGETVSKNTTIYAYYEPVTYTVKFNLNGGTGNDSVYELVDGNYVQAKKIPDNQKIYDRMFKQSSEAVTQARQMAE